MARKIIWTETARNYLPRKRAVEQPGKNCYQNKKIKAWQSQPSLQVQQVCETVKPDPNLPQTDNIRLHPKALSSHRRINVSFAINYRCTIYGETFLIETALVK